MKQLGKYLASALTMALLVASFGTAQAQDLAQKTEEFREAWETAVNAYQERNFSEAYKQFEIAARLGNELEDPKAKETARRAQQYLPRVAYAEGLLHLQNNRYDQALAAFDKGIARDANYLNNLIGKGQAYQRMERTDDAIATYVQALGSAQQLNDGDALRRAQDAIRAHYQPLASRTLASAGENASRSDAQRVLSLMDEMEEHVEADANGLYYRAAAYNILGEHQRAVALIDQALAMHNGSRTDQARFYFEKAEALRYMGDVAAAKEAYRNAAFGSYKQPAEHFLETL